MSPSNYRCDLYIAVCDQDIYVNAGSRKGKIRMMICYIERGIASSWVGINRTIRKRLKETVEVVLKFIIGVEH
jgi:hypothetical protein